MKRFILVFVVGCGFSQPKLHQADGGSNMPPDAADTCPSGGCELLAIEPSIANTGDTITLEGTFAAHATVNFPGGATAQATVLGDHRATVVVPAAATAGDLTVTSAGTTTAAASFRRASFQLGLQTFQLFDDQTNGARQMPSLVDGRNNQDVMVAASKGFVYVAGGTDASGVVSSVERAAINGDGSLGAFTVLTSTLTAPRQSGATIVIGDFLYAIGGDSAGTIERAAINADGSLGTFAVVTSSLPSPRFSFVVAVIGNFLYVIGGDDGTSSVLSTLRAPVASDGTLGAFSDAGTALAGPHGHAYSVVVGSELYVVGPANVDAAPIHPDGTLGAFAVAGTLTALRDSAPAFAIGGTLYVVGGFDATLGNLRTDVDAAAINPDGTLGAFAVAPNITLPIGQGGGSCLAGGNFYMIGGSDNGHTHSTLVQRASLNSSGGLTAPTTASVSLSNGRDRFAVSVVGNNLYLVGGSKDGTSLTSIDRAPINPDGSLGAFATLGVTHLVTARDEPGLAVIGNFMYVIGGAATGSGPFIGTVERAPINSDGSLGTFALVSGVTLATARNSFQTVVAGNNLYVIGGYNGGSPLASIERAPISADGTIGTFAQITSALQNGRNSASAFVSDGFLFIIDGCCPSIGVERAPIASDGSLGSFSTVANHPATSRFAFVLVVAGPTIYVAGGQSSTTLASIESAPIDGRGAIGAFASSSSALPAPLLYALGVRIGNFAYALGGLATTPNATSQKTVEQATLQ